MKLRQLARTFLKVGKIINIVLLALFAVLLVVFTIIGIVAIAAASAAADPDAALAAAVSGLLGALFGYGFTLVALVVALILNGKAQAITGNAKSKAEAKPGAIMAIVAGALVTAFPIASGILLLCTKEEDWNESLEQPAPAQVEEKKPEEPKAE